MICCVDDISAINFKNTKHCHPRSYTIVIKVFLNSDARSLARSTTVNMFWSYFTKLWDYYDNDRCRLFTFFCLDKKKLCLIKIRTVFVVFLGYLKRNSESNTIKAFVSMTGKQLLSILIQLK